MSERVVGAIGGIAIRTAEGGPMREIDRAVAVENGGLHGDIDMSPDRGVTFISAAQWREVTAELKAELPWHTRRANVLVECAGLGDLIGRTVQLGDVQVAVLAETKPGGIMDRLHPGLRKSLVPDCRGGVYGRVLTGGTFQTGDRLLDLGPT